MEKPKVYTLPLEWYSPENITTRYANQIVVQHSKDEFFISFYETRPPVILGTPDQQLAQLENIKNQSGLSVWRVSSSRRKSWKILL